MNDDRIFVPMCHCDNKDESLYQILREQFGGDVGSIVLAYVGKCIDTLTDIVTYCNEAKITNTYIELLECKTREGFIYLRTDHEVLELRDWVNKKGITEANILIHIDLPWKINTVELQRIYNWLQPETTGVFPVYRGSNVDYHGSHGIRLPGLEVPMKLVPYSADRYYLHVYIPCWDTRRLWDRKYVNLLHTTKFNDILFRSVMFNMNR
jgi:hypothetical protein